MLNHLARRGVEVITEADKHVHVSGHGSSEELKLVLSLVRPRYFIPIHGEYRQLARHARVAELVYARPCDAGHGADGRGRRRRALRRRRRPASSDKAPAGRVLIDSTRVGEVDDEVLRDRRHIAADGVVVPVVAINRQTGALEGVPELLVTRGFVTADDTAAPHRRRGDADRSHRGCGVEERTDPGLMQERIRTEVRRYLRKRTGRRPLVLPVVMEI